MDKRAFGRLPREARRRSLITRESRSAASGVGVRAISDTERGHSMPRQATPGDVTDALEPDEDHRTSFRPYGEVIDPLAQAEVLDRLAGAPREQGDTEAARVNRTRAAGLPARIGNPRATRMPAKTHSADAPRLEAP